MQVKEWVKVHTGGYWTIIRQTEEGIFELLLVEPQRERRLIAAGADRVWLERQLSIALLDIGHQCTEDCGPELLRGAKASERPTGNGDGDAADHAEKDHHG